MTDQMDEPTLRAHHRNMGIIAGLINVTSAYLGSPDGSGEEELAEEALAAAIGTAARLPEEAIGNMLLGLTSLIVAVTEPEDVQEWFNHQAEKIAEAME